MRWFMNGLLSTLWCLSLAASTLVAQAPREGDRPSPEAQQGARPNPEAQQGERRSPEAEQGDRPGRERGPGDRGPGDRGPGDRGPGGRGFGGPGGFGPGRMLARLPLMMALDADGNGEISTSEIEGAVAALKKLDKNSDGKLTADELMPEGMPGGPGGGFPGGPPDPEAMVARWMAFDSNKDGFIDKTEAPEPMQQQLFARADADNDGKLSKQELTRFANQMGGPRREGEGPRGGEGPRRDRDGQGDGGERPRRPTSE